MYEKFVNEIVFQSCVSIHIQLYIWMLAPRSCTGSCVRCRFNPHPIVRLDVEHYSPSDCSSNPGFNPHTIIKLNVSCGWWQSSDLQLGFNPHPIIRLDVSVLQYAQHLINLRFNPHSIIKLNVSK